MAEPVICFGQQPCGFFPKRFLWAKIRTARQLQARIGGRIVFFYHDSDHDLRETQTSLTDLHNGRETILNFLVTDKIQRKYSPLFAKQIAPRWVEETRRQLPKYVRPELVEVFSGIQADNPADFCLAAYRRMGLLEGIETVRSGNPDFRRAAWEIGDCFVDTVYENQLVRARRLDERTLALHKGGQEYLYLKDRTYEKSAISPTRDTRLRWMQSVIHCTHYVAGAGEMQYLRQADCPEIQYVEREPITESARAWCGE